MNRVSWIIYFADVANTFDIMCYIAMAGSVIACIICLFYISGDREDRRRVVSNADGYYNRAGNTPSQAYIDAIKALAPPEPKKEWLAMKRSIMALILAAFFAVITPASMSLYAIAASETAEQVLQSPTVTKAMNALNRWLDKQAK